MRAAAEARPRTHQPVWAKEGGAGASRRLVRRSSRQTTALPCWRLFCGALSPLIAHLSALAYYIYYMLWGRGACKRSSARLLPKDSLASQGCAAWLSPGVSDRISSRLRCMQFDAALQPGLARQAGSSGSSGGAGGACAAPDQRFMNMVSSSATSIMRCCGIQCWLKVPATAHCDRAAALLLPLFAPAKSTSPGMKHVCKGGWEPAARKRRMYSTVLV